MKNSLKYRLMLCVFLCIFSFAFISCSENLFGSSSSGGGSCSNNDVECLRISAEEMFRAGEYSKSYDLYNKIVQADPKASVGYYGMAKAGMWRRMNPFGIAGLARTRDDNSIPFINDPASEKNKYYQAMKDVYRALDKLERRDSLTAIYEVYMVYKEEGLEAAKLRTGGKVKDSVDFRERLDKFGRNFCAGGKSCKDTVPSTVTPRSGGELFESFPLSDRKYKRNSYIAGFSISKFLYELLRFLDINKDDCISTKDSDFPVIGGRTAYGCIEEVKRPRHDIDLNFINLDGNGISIDLSNAYEQIMADTAFVEELAEMFNDKIDDLYNGLGDIGSLIGTIGNGLWETAGGDTLGLDFDLGALGEVQEQIQENVDLYKDYLFFYKLYDGIDNDADGCLDESLMGFDTDGDGLAGEDIRLISMIDNWYNCGGKEIRDNGKIYTQKRCLNTTRDYTKYKGSNASEMNGYVMYITENPTEHSDTILKLKFADTNFNPDYWTLGDMDTKLKVQTEKENGTTRCYGLDERVRLIGGCWVNYSVQDFRDYRSNPKQVKDMNPECVGRY